MSDTPGAPRLSIVMPVLDEVGGIEAVLVPLQSWRGTGAELIVVDGGSIDDTRARAEPLADRVLVAPRGRATQMNVGANASRGELLLFLHADTRLPQNAQGLLETLAAEGPLWGRFDVRFDHDSALLGLVATLMNWRSRMTGVATGDQAMFVSRALFARVGGFPQIELMEDVALSKRLRRELPPRCLRARVTTSARRWLEAGPFRTIVLMWTLRLAYVLGVAPATLARWYRQIR